MFVTHLQALRQKLQVLAIHLEHTIRRAGFWNSWVASLHSQKGIKLRLKSNIAISRCWWLTNPSHPKICFASHPPSLHSFKNKKAQGYLKECPGIVSLSNKQILKTKQLILAAERYRSSTAWPLTSNQHYLESPMCLPRPQLKEASDYLGSACSDLPCAHLEVKRINGYVTVRCWTPCFTGLLICVGPKPCGKSWNAMTIPEPNTTFFATNNDFRIGTNN